MIRQPFSARISRRICDINTSVGKLIMGRLALLISANEGDITPSGVYQLTGSLNDSLVMPLGENNATTHGRGPSFKSFNKPHNASPAAIVTQEGIQQSGRNEQRIGLC